MSVVGRLDTVTNGRFQESEFNGSFPAMNLKSGQSPADPKQSAMLYKRMTANLSQPNNPFQGRFDSYDQSEMVINLKLHNQIAFKCNSFHITVINMHNPLVFICHESL